MITRRDLLLAASLALVAGRASGAGAADPEAAWSVWKTLYLAPDGRVIDPEQGISHSEGQAYGLILAQAFGDREKFSLIEAWSQTKLLTRDDALMAWRFDPETGDVAQDTATDGDLLRAWALLRAVRDSGWAEFEGRAHAIASAIRNRCLGPDPRAADEWLVLPSAGGGLASRVTINPSYFFSRALRELGAAFAEPDLIRAADHGETVLRELAANGPVPDWIDVTPDGFAPPTGHALRSGYDALRVPLYLCWSGRRDHPAVDVMARAFSQASTPGHVAVATAPGSGVIAESDAAGYRAVQALATCAPLGSAGAQRFYYPATLWLLVSVAQREGGNCA